MRIGASIAARMVNRGVVLAALALLMVSWGRASATATPTPSATVTPTLTSNRPRPVPVVSVRPDPARAGELVVLDASQSHGAIRQARWSQADEQPSVSLVACSAEGPCSEAWSTSFTAPAVSEPTILHFQLFLDSYGGTSGGFASVEVTILPADAVAAIAIGSASGPPGQGLRIAVHLASADQPVAHLRHHIDFPLIENLMFGENGALECEPNPAIEARVVFGLLPEGCIRGFDCNSLLADIQAESPIPVGSELYSCLVRAETPEGSCRATLGCSEASGAGVQDEPRAVACIGGEIEARFPNPDIGFTFEAVPAQPQVGEHVRVRLAVFNRTASLAGIPTYVLGGASPYLQGTTLLHTDMLRPVEFDLLAAEAGTAPLQVSVDFETAAGCPSNFFYYFTGDISPVFPLEILAAPTPSGTPTASETPTPSPTLTPTRTLTVTATSTATLTPSPTPHAAPPPGGCNAAPGGGAAAALLGLPLLVLLRRTRSAPRRRIGFSPVGASPGVPW